MRRYETRSTMMTSNRPLEDWGKLLGDVPSATAILDRFLHHAELVRMTGRSYRLRHQSISDQEGIGDSKPANAPPGSTTSAAAPKPANVRAITIIDAPSIRDNRWDVLDLTGSPSTGGLFSAAFPW